MGKQKLAQYSAGTKHFQERQRRIKVLEHRLERHLKAANGPVTEETRAKHFRMADLVRKQLMDLRA
jgi:hypothetical protein